ncbi:MAG TPA: MOP flippase family protein [Terracidiphilus sp.]|nr:MOP flippase family protein [Terracidiphilus sp.]
MTSRPNLPEIPMSPPAPPLSEIPVSSNLGISASSGIKWNFVSQGGQQVAQLLTMVVLARLLPPSDFGLLGMAAVILGFITIFKDLGTAAAVIRSRAFDPELLPTVFWANVAMGMLGTLLLVFTAPAVAAFYREPTLTGIMRALALGFFISGLSNLHKALLERKLAFRILAGVELTSVLAGAVAGISTAKSGFGVWALVAQLLTSTTFMTVLLWIFEEFKPSMTFSWRALSGLTSFSLNLTGFNVFNYVIRNADNLLIGRFLGPFPLGIYALAYRIMLYPLQSVTTVISRVMYPVYSCMQDDDARFRAAFARTGGLIALVTFPLMTGVCVLAEPFILVVFGPHWAGVIPLIRILAPIGMVESVAATCGAILQTKGRTDVMFKWGVFSGVIVLFAFVVGLRWGLLGVTTAYAIASILLTLPFLLISLRLLKMRLRELFRPLAGPLFASLVMAAVVLLLDKVLHLNSRALLLGFLVLTGVLLYTAVSWLFNRRQLLDALHLAMRKA